MKLFVYLLLCVTHFGASVYAQTMHIGLFDSKNVEAYTFSIRKGNYILECDNEKYGEYTRGGIFFISKNGNNVEVRDKRNQIGVFNKVKLVPQKEGIFTLRPLDINKKPTEYDDALYFRVEEGKLQAINYIGLEKYIAGVIEAEGGNSAPLEYYKAQAVLIRTYTIKNIYKHAEEGFNLCDGVHCQAYHGRSAQNKEIYEATKATAGEVLMDEDSILVMAPFHSSCGGQTSSAGIYWQTDLSYLQSVEDPFCVSQHNYVWEKEVSLMDWYAFLRKKGVPNPANYCEYTSTGRKKYFINNKYQVTFREIREWFGLRSSFLSVHRKGSKIILSGHGYGHGIGMCQIGAMEMAKVGYTYVDIIHFYFQNVSITDYREMELHRYRP